MKTEMSVPMSVSPIKVQWRGSLVFMRGSEVCFHILLYLLHAF